MDEKANLFKKTLYKLPAPLWLFERKVGDGRDSPLHVEVGMVQRL